MSFQLPFLFLIFASNVIIIFVFPRTVLYVLLRVFLRFYPSLSVVSVPLLFTSVAGMRIIFILNIFIYLNPVR